MLATARALLALFCFDLISDLSATQLLCYMSGIVDTSNAIKHANGLDAWLQATAQRRDAKRVSQHRIDDGAPMETTAAEA